MTSSEGEELERLLTHSSTPQIGWTVYIPNLWPLTGLQVPFLCFLLQAGELACAYCKWEWEVIRPLVCRSFAEWGLWWEWPIEVFCESLLCVGLMGFFVCLFSGYVQREKRGFTAGQMAGSVMLVCQFGNPWFIFSLFLRDELVTNSLSGIAYVWCVCLGSLLNKICFIIIIIIDDVGEFNEKSESQNSFSRKGPLRSPTSNPLL